MVSKILELGNECLQNLGVAEPIEDVQVFTCDAFYIQFFENAFPDFNFSSLAEAETEEDMAENIQALIELLQDEILNYDLSHIRGDEIVQGNPEHIINLLQLAKEISLLMRSGTKPMSDDQIAPGADEGDTRELLQDMALEGDEQDEDDALQMGSSSHKRRGGIAGRSYSDGGPSQQLQGEVSLNFEGDEGQHQLEPSYGQEQHDEIDYGSEQPDTDAVGIAEQALALDGSEDGVDQEIEQIVSKQRH